MYAYVDRLVQTGYNYVSTPAEPLLACSIPAGFFFVWRAAMKYDKPALSFEQQADRLINRGLIASRDLLVERLTSVNYYRLSGYLHPFRLRDDDAFYPGTTLEKVWNRYTFDRRLRLVLMDAIERIEVDVRTSLIYRLAHSSGPFGYTDIANLPNIERDRHGNFLSKLYEETKRSSESFVRHFRAKYGDQHGYLPIWMAGEIFSFGMTFTLYTGSEKRIKQEIASRFGVSDDVLRSWLLALNTVRNICAHHGRLWNRGLGTKPKIPSGSKHGPWHEPVEIENKRVFAILTICRYCLVRIAPQSSWTARFLALLDEYPEIPLRSMGFPENWKESPIWMD